MQITEWTFAGSLLADFDNDGAEIFIAALSDDVWRYCGLEFIPIDEIAAVGLTPAVNKMIQQILTNLATAQGLTHR